MKPMQPFGLATLVVILVGEFVCASAAQTGREYRLSPPGALKGRIAATKNDGSLIPADSATVYVIFNQAVDPVKGFPHSYNTDTAGRIYNWRHKKVLDSLSREIKDAEKALKQEPTPERSDVLAKYYLRSVDEAIEAATEWASEKANRTWQISKIKPDSQGLWSVNSLNPAEYLIVVRGTISGHEAVWEGEVDLEAERTVQLNLDMPRFLRRTK